MKGPDPVDNAGERRIPRGGSLQESGFRVWPAAIDPQTPTVPGAKRPPGFSHHSGGTREELGESPAATFRRLRREMLVAEREVFVAHRDAGRIDDEVLRRVMHELDLEEAMLDRD